MTLHFSQILFTEGRTFMSSFLPHMLRVERYVHTQPQVLVVAHEPTVRPVHASFGGAIDRLTYIDM